VYSGNELSPQAQKNRRRSYGAEKAYWPTLSRLGEELVLARPRKFRILTNSRSEFFAVLQRHREYFADLVAKELPMFRFVPTQRIRDQKKPGAWLAPLTEENFKAVEEMCAHGKEIFLNVSDGIGKWLKEAHNGEEE